MDTGADEVTARCEELATIGVDPTTDPPPRQGHTDECEGCIAIDERHWAHLRICLTCGYVGCCDSSPRKHASTHYEDTGHPVMRSAEPGELWRWCFVHYFVG